MGKQRCSAVTIYWRTNARGRLVFWTGNAEDHLGISPSMAIGRSPGRLVPGSQESGWPLRQRRAFRRKRIVCAGRHGLRLLLVNSGAPRYTPDGSFQGFSGSLKLWCGEKLDFPSHFVRDWRTFRARFRLLLQFSAATRCGLAFLTLRHGGDPDLRGAARLLADDSLVCFQSPERFFAVFSCDRKTAPGAMSLTFPCRGARQDRRVFGGLVVENPVRDTEPHLWFRYLQRAVGGPLHRSVRFSRIIEAYGSGPDRRISQAS